MTLSYSKPARLSLRRLARLTGIAVCVLLGFYLLGYVVAYSNRGAAANRAYFMYARNEGVDVAAYRLFYPVYFVHTRMLGGQRHNGDRRPLTSFRDTPIEL